MVFVYFMTKLLTSADDIATTEGVTSVRAGQSTEESTNDEDGNNNTLNGAVLALCGASKVDCVDLGECLHPILLGQKTTNTCLVVTEQDERRSDDETKLELGQGRACGAKGSTAHLCEIVEEGR